MKKNVRIEYKYNKVNKVKLKLIKSNINWQQVLLNYHFLLVIIRQIADQLVKIHI